MKRLSISPNSLRLLASLSLIGSAYVALLPAADQDGKSPAVGVGSELPATPALSKPRTGPTAPENVLDRHADIRVDKNMVLVPVAVTTQTGQYVTGLDKENFKIFENNVEQQIESFTSEDAPMSVGVVFDTSGSMGNKLQRSRQAVAEFMKSANPEDEFLLVQFNDRGGIDGATSHPTPNSSRTG